MAVNTRKKFLVYAFVGLTLGLAFTIVAYVSVYTRHQSYQHFTGVPMLASTYGPSSQNLPFSNISTIKSNISTIYYLVSIFLLFLVFAFATGFLIRKLKR